MSEIWMGSLECVQSQRSFEAVEREGNSFVSGSQSLKKEPLFLNVLSTRKKLEKKN